MQIDPKLVNTLKKLGGLAKRCQLPEFSNWQLSQLHRPHRGWYCLTPRHPGIAAVCLSGKLTCVSAAASFGFWVREPDRVQHPSGLHLEHISRPQWQHWEYGDRNVVIHWTRSANVTPVGKYAPAWRTPLTRTIMHIVRCQPMIEAIATIDSALRMRRIDRVQLKRIFKALPKRYGNYLQCVDPASGSGIESYVRVAGMQRGWKIQTQVEIPGVGRVDFVIEGRIVVEVDGYNYHASREQFERDRERERRLHELGYTVRRFSYQQVMNNLSGVLDAIEKAIARG